MSVFGGDFRDGTGLSVLCCGLLRWVARRKCSRLIKDKELLAATCTCAWLVRVYANESEEFSLERENPNFDGVEKQVTETVKKCSAKKKNREEGQTWVVACSGSVLFVCAENRH